MYGVTGSGKTTLASQLSEVTGICWHSVDDLCWEPGWVETPHEVQRSRIQAIVDQDEWILDTAYGKWIELPLARADLIVGLDYPRWLSLARLLARTTRRVVTGEKACNGNRERLSMVFSQDSIIGWHFKSFARKRQRIRAWKLDPNAPETLVFKSPRQVEAWLRGLS